MMPGKPDALGERVVDVDRHLVARGVAVAERLVVVDVDGERRHLVAADVRREVVIGLVGSGGLTVAHAADEDRHVLRDHRAALAVGTVDLDDEAGARSRRRARRTPRRSS